MELKDFVSDTLMQIAEGVKDAQSKYKQRTTVRDSRYSLKK